MAIAPVNKFVSIAVPVAPGLQKLYEVPTGTSALLLYTQVSNVGIAVTYPTVTFVQKRTSRSTGNTRDIRVIKDAEIPPNDAVILIDGRLVLEKTPLVLDQIYVQGNQSGIGTITNVVYDEPTGIATITTKESHKLNVTDPVTMSGIAFTCLGTTGITTTIFPDPQQSYIVDTLIGEVGTSKTFSAVVGSSKGYPHVYNSAIHYFERARDNAVEVAVGTGGYTSFTAISGTTYSPTTGNLVIKTASAHGLSVGDLIRINDGGITFTCATDSNGSNHPYPRATDPASGKLLTITAVTSDTFTVDVGTSSDTSTHTFVSGVANAIKKINTRFNVTNAVYNGGPQTTTIHGIENLAPGDIVLTLNANHNLTGGNKIRIALNSIIFTCTMDNRATEHPYPRKTDPAAPTPRPNDAKNLGGDIAISVFSANQLRLNVAPSLSGGFFAPLQMELIASILENSTS
tara:strand:- start:582 stop:1955 length:1374 start_codon:yes stop_codon:yes gene_type:complete